MTVSGILSPSLESWKQRLTASEAVDPPDTCGPDHAPVPNGLLEDAPLIFESPPLVASTETLPNACALFEIELEASRDPFVVALLDDEPTWIVTLSPEGIDPS